MTVTHKATVDPVRVDGSFAVVGPVSVAVAHTHTVNVVVSGTVNHVVAIPSLTPDTDGIKAIVEQAMSAATDQMTAKLTEVLQHVQAGADRDAAILADVGTLKAQVADLQAQVAASDTVDPKFTAIADQIEATADNIGQKLTPVDTGTTPAPEPTPAPAPTDTTTPPPDVAPADTTPPAPVPNPGS